MSRKRLSTIEELDSSLGETQRLLRYQQVILKRNEWRRLADPEALHFAARLAIVLTVASLFNLLRSPNHSTYPNGTWVIISALFVSWFPSSRDAASVLEKIMQRWMGTCIGATLGIICGCASLMFPHRVGQACFLGFCAMIVTFCIVGFAGTAQLGRVKLIQKYSYATLLCMSTFFICMMPFALDGTGPKWVPGMFRVINVTLGCVIAGMGALLIYPRSTHDILHQKTARQVTLAGEACKVVLLAAAESFSGRMEVPLLSSIIMRAKRVDIRRMSFKGTLPVEDEQNTAQALSEVGLEIYDEAISDWKATKALFPLLPFDPLRFFGHPTDNAFITDMATTLSRALRIQTTAVVLDGMVRNTDECAFSPQQLLLFAETGTLIRQMLTLPLQVDRSDDAADELFKKLEQVRKYIIDVSVVVADHARKRMPKESVLETNILDFRSRLLEMDAESIRMDDDGGRGYPQYATDVDDNAMLFLQLVEHLIVRSLRLYHAWKKEQCRSCFDR